jgi:hypothetical protein
MCHAMAILVNLYVAQSAYFIVNHKVSIPHAVRGGITSSYTSEMDV